MTTDSVTTKAEKLARHDNGEMNDYEEPPSKRARTEGTNGASENLQTAPQPRERVRGVAPVKAEYILPVPDNRTKQERAAFDDDAAEAAHHEGEGRPGKKEKNRGQNKGREFGSSKDALPLCASVMLQPEFSPLECRFGTKCKFEHDLRRYLKEGRREDLKTFNGQCPIWDLKGHCEMGWKCRFVGSHSTEREVDGKKELILLDDDKRKAQAAAAGDANGQVGVVNDVHLDRKKELSRKKFPLPKSDKYVQWLNEKDKAKQRLEGLKKDEIDETMDNRAQFVDPPLLPSEKRRIYYGPETPILAPLTTTGNLPFRRLCVGFGAQVTWSEMALGLPLITGHKGEWALMKAHESETLPPAFTPGSPIIRGYSNENDLKFGAQIAANKPWLALKTAETLSNLCTHLRAIDLNCGCPIDLVCNDGAGSALLDHHAKLEKMLRGMNTVSGPIPITVKIRMGTTNSHPTAEKLVARLINGGAEESSPCGVAAITLHGRSRQQRYSRAADWSYISSCAALIKRTKETQDALVDTTAEPDARFAAPDGKVYFIGNGDVYSHADYNAHLNDANVDSVMVARGALIKPWIFEEIASGQYLDKSATERLSYIETFVKHGLEAWGSDEMGVGTTRRFLLEWLSFACRYVPIGLLEHLPPNIQDRPPRYRGRNELETLLSSDNYRDWIKIRYVGHHRGLGGPGVC
ncbi:tRNA-dihydrouridine(47) synthase [NAD(P)(+)] [Pseudovirgaria hyperparasitica]|uniref:tRNA-dihydrouridine(47) synthase [NAD(P)(+)] n=1 Tax=Pseudovirgaria hyperparasitica TaxID=470096 RepID=A0A6A6WBX5_9PEZI|nr:tRNA-dihydrouridine(47) synthase [NAD(P)(+)] [Pseudovirgaria hyperparasitica]KAF2758611.1 tRNA-dihydrouridine(47) synthase [NAD(P)(+)] [Pseudovirgaria hyperparasitica]